MAGTEGKGAAAPSKLDLDVAAGFVGFALFVASSVGFFVVAPRLLAHVVDAFPLRLCGSLGMMAAFGVICLAAHAIARGRCVALLAMAAVGVAALAGMLLLPGVSALAALVLAAVAGAGLAALATLWFTVVCAQQHRIVLLFVSMAVGVGAAGCLAMLFLVDHAARFALAAAWAASWACLLALVRKRPDKALPPVIGNRESDKRSKILWTSTIMLSVNSFEFGILLGTAPSESEVVACLVAAALAAALLSLDFSRRRLVTERSLSPLVPPVTVMAFLLLYLFGEAATWVSLCLLAVLFAVYSTFGLAAMAEHARISRLSLPRTFGKARFLDYVGLSLGLACGFAIAQLAAASEMDAVRATAVVAIAYGFVASYCHKARFPDTSMEEGGHSALPEAKGLWKKRCRAVSEECGLSERQYEVLVLVAQGRNAKYIEQALTISLSTAQTHIRNIYRKTGVHSRQELLDLIEDTKLYGEE